MLLISAAVDSVSLNSKINEFEFVSKKAGKYRLPGDLSTLQYCKRARSKVKAKVREL